MLSHAEPRAVPDPGGLGRRIATLRHANGWSQRRLAEAAGVSHGYIALLELGRLPSPGKFRLDAIARALNLRTSDALFNDADPDARPSAVVPGEDVHDAGGRGVALREEQPASGAPSNVRGGLDQLRPAGAQPLP